MTQKAHRPQKSEKEDRNEAKGLLDWIGFVLVVATEFLIMTSAHLTIKNTALFCFGGLWIWRGIAVGFLKIKGVYNSGLTRKQEIILAVTDGFFGLSWVTIALLAGAKQLQMSLMLLCVIPAFIVNTALSIKTENRN